MNTKLAPLFAASLIAMLPSSPVHADGNTCVPWARSVPKLYDAPSWAASMGGAVDTSLDDPRWNDAVAQSFAYGSAVDPLHVRAVWHTEGGTNYLYLSFISDLSPDTSVARDIFLGFRPKTQTNAGATKGYVLQFHLEGATQTTAAELPYCGRYKDSMGYACNTAGRTLWWRAFASDGTPGDCGSIVGGAQFKQIGTETTAPFSWLTGNVHAWQSSADSRWAVQMRLKIAGTGDIASGIEDGSTFWYQATQSLAPTALASLGVHPANVTTSLCRSQQAGNDRIVHAELSTATEWSALTYVAQNAPLDASCDQGLMIDAAHIGAVYNTSGPYDTIALTNRLDSPLANTVIAQVVNTGSSYNGPVQGRFRIADWGAQVPGAGDWRDIPGGSAVKATLNIPSGQQKALSFNWTLDAKDLCQYGFAGASCEACTTCGDTVNGCIQVTGQPATCTNKKTPNHQCVQVTLTSPNATAKFLRASAFRNLDFDTLSTLLKTALIDVKGVPGRVASAPQDVLLVLVPRSMPGTVPQQTGAQLLATRAMAEAVRISGRHAKRIKKLNAAELTKFSDGRVPLSAAALKDKKLVGLNGARLRAFEASRVAIPKVDFEVTAALRDFATDTINAVRATPAGGKPDAATATRTLVHAVGPDRAARIVPTVEVYPFYKPAKGDVYLPMTAFSVFLSHDGELVGFTKPELTGAGVTKLPGAKANVYQLTIPANETKARVTIKAESKDRPTPPTKKFDKTILTW